VKDAKRKKRKGRKKERPFSTNLHTDDIVGTYIIIIGYNIIIKAFQTVIWKSIG